MTVILFVIILGALIFVHELGHFIVAKKADIRVDEFALGFPPKLFRKKIGETVYSLNLIPFGGYVKIYGEDGGDADERGFGTQIYADVSASPSAREGDRREVGADVSRRFTSKPRWVQALVLFSGVAGNIIFAWLLISIGFLSGVPSSVEGRYATYVQHPELMITSVLPNSPAERAGLKAGDAILSLQEGSRVFRGIDDESARAFIAASTGKLTIEYKRGGTTQNTEVEPVEGIVSGKKAIGVTLDTVGVVQFGFFRSFYEGALMTWDLLREVTVGIVGFIKQVFLGQADLAAITGPVGIAGLVGEARVLGLVYLLSFTAFISINLAVINLLPIPALDGGRLLFLAIEAIICRPIPTRFTRIVNTAGFVLLILLMVVITYRDILKLL